MLFVPLIEGVFKVSHRIFQGFSPPGDVKLALVSLWIKLLPSPVHHFRVGESSWPWSLHGLVRLLLPAVAPELGAHLTDAYEVLALGPVPREERAQQARLYVNSRFTTKQQLFIDFVLQHYVTMGVQELAQEKLAPLLRLRYQNSIADALEDLGGPQEVGQIFSSFQRYLYEPVGFQ